MIRWRYCVNWYHKQRMYHQESNSHFLLSIDITLNISPPNTRVSIFPAQCTIRDLIYMYGCWHTDWQSRWLMGIWLAGPPRNDHCAHCSHTVAQCQPLVQGYNGTLPGRFILYANRPHRRVPGFNWPPSLARYPPIWARDVRAFVRAFKGILLSVTLFPKYNKPSLACRQYTLAPLASLKRVRTEIYWRRDSAWYKTRQPTWQP